jgi:MutS domain V
LNPPPAANPHRAQPPQAHGVYSAKLEALAQQQQQLRIQDRIFGWSKLLCALAAIAVGLWLARLHPRLLGWALLPAIAFVMLWIAHERLLRALRAATRLESLYRGGLERLEDRWAGTGDDGLRFLHPSHPYARDLDLFGAGSLFQLLSRAVTAAGQRTLADWLLQAADPRHAEARQAAVAELAAHIDLRERLALSGDEQPPGGAPSLTAWAETAQTSVPRLLRIAALPLAAVWFAALLWWIARGAGAPLLAISALNLALTYRYRALVMAGAAAAEQAAHGLRALASVLAAFEAQSFVAPRLLALTRSLRADGIAPSRAVAQLRRTMHWLESSDNWFVKLLDLFAFWTPLCMLAVERWRRRYGAHVRTWLTAVGEFEALCSLATFHYERPDARFPTFLSEGPAIEACRLIHPLLPANTAVPNDLTLHPAGALLMVSGPNMAGKSTLLRAIGLNLVLAQCGAPVCASSMTLSPLAIGASITVQDSLQSGLSRFYAEIQRLKQIDALARTQPTLFLLDELLSGTNSHDRRVGTEALLRGLLAQRAIGLVTTHDLALTEIVTNLGGGATNMHFGDRFLDGKLHFDYRMTPGIADSTNALELMRSVGLDV